MTTGVPRPMAGGGFRATHRTPAGGLKLWKEPHAFPQEVGVLEGGLDVAVTAETGAWAEVRAANGQAGWVNGTRLESLEQQAVALLTDTAPSGASQHRSAPEPTPLSTSQPPAATPVVDVAPPSPPSSPVAPPLPPAALGATAISPDGSPPRGRPSLPARATLPAPEPLPAAVLAERVGSTASWEEEPELTAQSGDLAVLSDVRTSLRKLVDADRLARTLPGWDLTPPGLLLQRPDASDG